MEKLRINSPVINKPIESEPQYFNLSQLKYLYDKVSRNIFFSVIKSHVLVRI